LFNTIKKFLPARANKSVGIAIEPHLLERNRIEWKPLRTEENNYEGGVDIEQYLATDDYIANDGRVNHIEGGIDKDTWFKFFGEQHNAEGGIDPDSYLNFFGEQHTEEGTIDPDSYLKFGGEQSNLAGGIDPDSYLNFFGEQHSAEGETGQTDFFNWFGETSNIEGGTDQDAGFNLSGTSRRYEGETDAETQIILSGRTPNYEGGTEAETEVGLSGTSRRYEGETVAENEVDLGGEAVTYEGNALTPLRESYVNPIVVSLNHYSWSMVSGSDRGAALKDVLRGGEVFAEFGSEQDSEVRFVSNKFGISGSYNIETHQTSHPDAYREIHWKSGSVRFDSKNLEPYEYNDFINDDTHKLAFENPTYRAQNNVVIRYKAAEYQVPFSSIIANQRYDGMKMASKYYQLKPIPGQENAGNTYQETEDMGSGYDGKPGITPVHWLTLSDSPDTQDGGPVVVVTETSPTQLVVTDAQQQNNMETQ
jgi:hypothetical protein